jgi:hypothetical protein
MNVAGFVFDPDAATSVVMKQISSAFIRAAGIMGPVGEIPSFDPRWPP